jgi:uncharacterized RDD family membrane protein YckC
MQIASLGLRVVACILDIILLLIVMTIFSFVTGNMASDGVGFAYEGGSALISFVVGFGYFIVSEALWGGTPAKLALGLRVVREEDGAPIDWAKSLVRNILRIVDGLFFYLVGFIIALSSAKTQRLGDKLAKTVVIKL